MSQIPLRAGGSSIQIVADPTEQYVIRPLADHLKDYEAHLRAKGSTEGHLKKTTPLLKRLFQRARFVYPRDSNSAKAADRLNQQRQNEQTIPIPEQEFLTTAAVAKLLGATNVAIDKRMKTMGLSAAGAGKARRIPLEAMIQLAQASARGIRP